MLGFKKVLLVFLVLAALFAGAFTATLVAGRISSASAASSMPTANNKVEVYSDTVVVPDLGDGLVGYKCGVPSQAGGSNFTPNAGNDTVCLLDQFAVPNPPLSISCMMLQVNSSQDTFFQNEWQTCYVLGSGIRDFTTSLDLSWQNGQERVVFNNYLSAGTYVFTAVIAK